MAEVYDIVICPICNGMASVVDGQKMYNNQVYDVRKPCPNMKCHQGRMEVLRIDKEDDDGHTDTQG